MDPLPYAVPAFLALCGVEAWALWARGSKAAYRLADFVSGMACGTLDQVVNVAIAASFLALYDAVARSHALVVLDASSPWVWAAAVLAHDLAYYWFHRASHRVSALWAAHVVHHQGEDYNFTVSLRQGTVATWVTFAFYLPLAVVGFPLEMFVVVHGVYQIYQFFVHTELCPRLGPLEWIFATPRHHRIHHGRNPEYVDKNYGGFFIVWDRLFGTFAHESVEPEIGSLAGISSWSPIWANVGAYADLARKAHRVRGFWQKALVWLGPPEGPAPEPKKRTSAAVPHYDRAPTRALATYASLQIAVAAAATLYLLLAHATLPPVALVSLGVSIVLTLVTVCAIFDARAWATRAEIARLVSLVPATVLVTTEPLALASAALFALASAGLLRQSTRLHSASAS